MSQISINNFEEILDAKILEKGHQIFTSGQIVSLHKNDHDNFLASIEGTQTYQTSIDIKNQDIMRYSCNCPAFGYQMCKHIVALMYAIKNFVQGNELPVKTAKKTNKRMTLIDKLQADLNNLSKEEMMEHIVSYARDDRYFRNFMHSKCVPKNDLQLSQPTKKAYSQIIGQDTKLYIKKNGDFNYQYENHAIKVINNITTQAQQAINQQNYDLAIMILQASIETLYKSISNNYYLPRIFSNSLNSIWDTMANLAESVKTDNNKRKDLLMYFTQESAKSIYEIGSTWQNLLRMGLILINNPQTELGIVLNACDEVAKQHCLLQSSKQDNFKYKYQFHDIIRFKRYCCEVFEEIELSAMIRNQNLQFADFSLEKISEDWQKGDLNSIKQLAQYHLKDKNPSHERITPKDFEDWLFRVAKKEQDTDTINYYLQRFFYKYQDWQSYHQLKNHLSAEKWQDFFNNTSDLLLKNGSYHLKILIKMYQEDNKLAEIVEIIDQLIDKTSFTVDCESLLTTIYTQNNLFKDDFREKLFNWYSVLIDKCLLGSTSNRSLYTKICYVLVNLKNDPKSNLFAEQLKSDLLVKYKNRRSLIEELQNV